MLAIFFLFSGSTPTIVLVNLNLSQPLSRQKMKYLLVRQIRELRRYSHIISWCNLLHPTTNKKTSVTSVDNLVFSVFELFYYFCDHKVPEIFIFMEHYLHDLNKSCF